ncbi:MAG: hypothetical protein JXQ85_00535 [Cognatishimia sp.]|uniref:hypothetical protein n=1 Tax=Cognatishimia sp. TaxID=2211648 RepID=UPI003B8D8818
MNDKATALSHISDALRNLEDARKIISDLLINSTTQAGGGNVDKRFLEDLHKRVIQATTVLPHSGRNTSNSTKGRNEI